MRHGGSTSSYPPRSGYDELDTTLMPPRPGEQFPGGQSSAAGKRQFLLLFKLFLLPLWSACIPKCKWTPPVLFWLPFSILLSLGRPGRLSSVDDPHSSLQGSVRNFDPNNSVFEDSNSINHAGHPPYGAPRAIFDEEDEPPPLSKNHSRSTLGSDSRGFIFNRIYFCTCLLAEHLWIPTFACLLFGFLPKLVCLAFCIGPVRVRWISIKFCTESETWENFHA